MSPYTIWTIIIMVELQRGWAFTFACSDVCSRSCKKDKIAWECDNGGQLWPASVANVTMTTSFLS
jgi:hypothetical protein